MPFTPRRNDALVSALNFMNRIIIIALLLSAPLAVAQKYELMPNSGKVLSRACNLVLDVNFYHPRKIKNRFEAFDLGYCLGMVKGVYEAGSGNYFCPKDGLAIKGLLEITVQFVAQHPDLQEKDPADIIRWAFTDEFPCPNQNHPESDTQGGAQ
jgi:Rap1a immunity proteins